MISSMEAQLEPNGGRIYSAGLTCTVLLASTTMGKGVQSQCLRSSYSGSHISSSFCTTEALSQRHATGNVQKLLIETKDLASTLVKECFEVYVTCMWYRIIKPTESTSFRQDRPSIRIYNWVIMKWLFGGFTPR